MNKLEICLCEVCKCKAWKLSMKEKNEALEKENAVLHL